MPRFMTNVDVYRAIAEEAAVESARLTDAARRPRGDGGFIVTMDPEQRSFKQALIAIAFAGMYLEALLRLEGKTALRKGSLKEFKDATWEAKLTALGVQDASILDGCSRLRRVRNDLVHETAVPMDGSSCGGEWWRAQEEAERAVESIRRVAAVISDRRKAYTAAP